MTDNRTDELRISEPLRGFIRHQSNRAYIDGGQARWLTEIADKIDAKHEQAIAATLGSCTLTAEQVRKAIFSGSVYASYDGAQYYANGIGMQSIADELNAELGSGTCEFNVVEEFIPGKRQRWNICECSNCGFIVDERFKCCPNCGARVRKKADE